ncbi:hypothetical protein AV530_005206 [Patagioenas fasciata monilis]|uniref:Uncharacterized protein n=1 Tax=Patagioenas fasciata monilis TaxID=372326 RepID=A0A1V4JKF5_PATFA|nr:hypothetical protein AV530_005206 [Patagioenas fasciata monilis]
MVKVLQDQLAAERNTTQWLHVALSHALDQEKILQSKLEEYKWTKNDQTNLDSVPEGEPGFTSPSQAAEEQGLKLLYPAKELEIIWEVSYPKNGQATMRPLIKTKSTHDGQEEVALQVTTQTIPYSVADLSEIQEKYRKLAQETEIECVLTGGYEILLSDDEA